MKGDGEALMEMQTLSVANFLQERRQIMAEQSAPMEKWQTEGERERTSVWKMAGYKFT